MFDQARPWLAPIRLTCGCGRCVRKRPCCAAMQPLQCSCACRGDGHAASGKVRGSAHAAAAQPGAGVPGACQRHCAPITAVSRHVCTCAFASTRPASSSGRFGAAAVCCASACHAWTSACNGFYASLLLAATTATSIYPRYALQLTILSVVVTARASFLNAPLCI